ncbi:MAG: c-type cytochrome domain-containing protein, partial [Verrucomicrobiota bacterium]
MKIKPDTICWLGLALFLGPAVMAEEPDELTALPIEEIRRDTPVDFATEIYPFLKRNCIACHNESKAKAKLILESPGDILKGSENGPVIKPGSGKDSFLLQSAAHEVDPPMPPARNKANAKNLTARELGLLSLWIDQGAKGEAPSAIPKKIAWQAPSDQSQPVYAVAVSHDGRFAFCGRSRDVYVYHARTGQPLGVLDDPETDGSHNDMVQSLAISPRGLLASGGFRSVKLWRPARNPVLDEVPAAGPVTALAVSPDGTKAAAGDQSGQVMIWNLGGEKELKKEKVHQGAVTALTFSKDGRSIISGSADQKIRWRHWADNKDIATWDVGHPIRGLLPVLDGNKVAAATPKAEVMVYDHTADTPTEWKAHGKGLMALHPVGAEGKQMLSVGEDGVAHLWQLDQAKSIRSLNHGGAVLDSAVSPDGQWCLTAGGEQPSKLWTLSDGKMVAEIRSDTRPGERLEQIKRNETLAQRLKEHRARQVTASKKAWDEAEKKLKSSAEEEVKKKNELVAKVTAFETAMARRDGLEELVKRYEAIKHPGLKAKQSESQKAVGEFDKARKELEDAEGALRTARFTRQSVTRDVQRAHQKHVEALSGQTLADGELVAVQARRAEQEKVAAGQVPVQAAAWSSDNQCAYTLGKDGLLRAWSARAGAPAYGWEGVAEATVMAATPDGRLLLGGADKTVRICDPRPRWILVRTLTNLAGRVTSLAFHPNGRV